MNKKAGFLFWMSFLLNIVLLGLIFFYFVLYSPNNEKLYEGKHIENKIKNLTSNSTSIVFDKNFVFYLLYELKAYNLHNPPLSSDTPKIEIEVNDKVYNSLIKEGNIEVNDGRISGEDIKLKITEEELIKMLKDKNYVMQSFNEGKSEIELIAPSTTLIAKGYLNFYKDLSGRSITGNLIRIYIA